MTSLTLQLDHVASAYRRYPGEPLTFHTRVVALPPAEAGVSAPVGAGVSPSPPAEAGVPSPVGAGVSPSPPAEAGVSAPVGAGVSPSPPAEAGVPAPVGAGVSPSPPVEAGVSAPVGAGVSPSPPVEAGVSPSPPSPPPTFTLRVTLPDGVTLERTEAPPEVEEGPRVVTWPEGGQTVTWLDVEASDEAQAFALHTTVSSSAGTGASFPAGAGGPSFAGAGDPSSAGAGVSPSPPSVGAGVSPSLLGYDNQLVSRAFLEVADDESARVTETVTVAVFAKGRYLRHLPALYERDELMGRFLMLFESFWDPIEGQIDQLPHYFDPRTAPPDLLPWLAAWLDLVLDERWPESKRRQLLQSAVHLYRRRGTRDGLVDYLEIYTGARPQIVEHRAENFVLGPEARLGQGIAIGRRNAPHTFTVKMELPTLPKAEAESRRRMIEQIIEAEKPAHTAYLLDLS